MSLYVFALDGEKGLPDKELLNLLCARIGFNNIFCAPECAFAGKDISSCLKIPYRTLESLSEISPDESERGFSLRIKKEKDILLQKEEHSVLLLPLNTAKVFCGLNTAPCAGYSEVLE
ncbi:MAG: hypothetical protein J6Q24_05880 [Clostridia bacterium]|nr:hypothetical protein [Clostridia bacterium]